MRPLCFASRSRSVVTVFGLLLLVLSSFVAAAPADAVPASKLLGHRCHLYDPAVTNEDTVAALEDVAKEAPGAWCEIDAWRISDGTLIVFQGKRALHRVTPVRGARTRIIALFSYDRRPDMFFPRHVHINAVGRTLDQGTGAQH